MSKKKKILAGVLILFVLLVNVLVIMKPANPESGTVTVNRTLKSEDANEFQMFYLTPGQKMPKGFSEEQSEKVWYDSTGKKDTFSFEVPKDIAYLRLDFGNIASETEVTGINFSYKFKKVKMDSAELLNIVKDKSVSVKDNGNGGILIDAGKKDPFVVWDTATLGIPDMVHSASQIYFYAFKIIFLLVVDL